MAKKPFNPLQAFGDFIADHLDGSIFDIEKKVTEVVKGDNANELVNGNETGNETPSGNSEGKHRSGSTFTNSGPKEKGASVNRGNGEKGGNDGGTIPADKGDETGKSETK